MTVTPGPMVGWLEIWSSLASDLYVASTETELIRYLELMLQKRRQVRRACCISCLHNYRLARESVCKMELQLWPRELLNGSCRIIAGSSESNYDAILSSNGAASVDTGFYAHIVCYADLFVKEIAPLFI